MPKRITIYSLTALLFSSCTTTFGGTLLVLGFRDLILYVLLAFVFAVVIAFKSKREKRVRAFWIWFILSLLLTPLAGFICSIYLFTRKQKQEVSK